MIIEPEVQTYEAAELGTVIAFTAVGPSVDV